MDTCNEGTFEAQPCGLEISFPQEVHVVMALNQGSRKTSAHSCAIGGKTESGGLSLLSGPWPNVVHSKGVQNGEFGVWLASNVSAWVPFCSVVGEIASMTGQEPSSR